LLSVVENGDFESAQSRRPLLPLRMPGKAGRAYRAGDNLSLTDADTGKRTGEKFLAERVG
jgi:hypothetical protein